MYGVTLCHEFQYIHEYKVHLLQSSSNQGQAKVWGISFTTWVLFSHLATWRMARASPESFTGTYRTPWYLPHLSSLGFVTTVDTMTFLIRLSFTFYTENFQIYNLVAAGSHAPQSLELLYWSAIRKLWWAAALNNTIKSSTPYNIGRGTSPDLQYWIVHSGVLT